MRGIALSEVIGDFVERALLPFLGLREPENPALRIERGAFPAQGFLTANCHQPVHALTLLPCEAIPTNQANRVSNLSSRNFCAYCDAEWDSNVSLHRGSSRR